jgi:hypothetical protein
MHQNGPGVIKYRIGRKTCGIKSRSDEQILVGVKVDAGELLGFLLAKRLATSR